MIYENLQEFKGQTVVDWDEGDSVDFATTAVRLRVQYDEADEGITIGGKLADLLEASGSDQLQSLVIGTWEPQDTSADTTELVESLVAARSKLPRLRNLFLGDIIAEECEISWIRQTDLSALLAAYENLEHLTVRGGENLSFGNLRHAHLKELIVQTGGLPPSVIHEIAAADLPALEHLELWLGDPNYGGDATVEDLAPLFKKGLFPKLRYLGLKDSVIEDEIAGVIALAPVLEQLQVLDLSMGALSDEGAKALVASPLVRKLKKLDLHYHYISDAMMKKLKSLGIEVDLEDPQDAEGSGDADDRYIAVSE